ncbi:MAG: hypothetical protein UHK60_01440 [Acutalibacteraceae bacterium]|nr:hypothetical protein [Acutalibacteraceae bacterium]
MLKKMKEINKKTKVIILAVGLIAIAGVGSVITACTMSKPDEVQDENKTVATESATEATEQTTEEVTELPTEEETEEATEKATEETTEEATEKPTEKPTEKKDKENKKEEATVVQTTTTIVGGNQNNNNSNNNTNTSTGNTNTGATTQNKPVNNNTTNNTTTNNNTGNSKPAKVWHEAEYKTVHHPAETKKVWVVDQEGYTYEEPVYETHAITVCNICGVTISNTSELSVHGKSHMLNGENFSYRSETREIQVGTKTVTVEEKGHWETQVVNEAWDEQVLIREAGYY